MKRLFYFIVALISFSVFAVEIGPIKIQRRNPIEATRGVQNDLGELTYSVGADNTGILTVGASEGNAVVGDPFAIRLAPQRILADDEWAVSLDGGAVLNEDGTYEFFDGYKTLGTTRGMTLSTVNPHTKIARVVWEDDYYMSKRTVVTSEDSFSLTYKSEYDAFMDPLENGVWAFVSNIVVYAWSTDSRSASVDFTLSDLTVTDDVGSYEMSGLRSWMMDRYDYRTGDQWSKFSATHDVRLAGKPIIFDSLGVMKMSSWWNGATNTLAVLVHGTPVLEVVPGSPETTDQLKIVDYSIEGTQAVFYVSSVLLSPIGLQRTDSLSEPSWSDVSSGLTSSYPTVSQLTVGDTTFDVYVLTLALDPEDMTGFFRAKATVDGLGGTSLEIKNCTLIYNGHELGIVTQVVDTVSYEVIGRVLP